MQRSRYSAHPRSHSSCNERSARWSLVSAGTIPKVESFSCLVERGMQLAGTGKSLRAVQYIGVHVGEEQHCHGCSLSAPIQRSEKRGAPSGSW